jgi:hypothetical protein
MATKIQRARRIGGIAIAGVKTVFRTGRAWGSARTRAATARRSAPTVPAGAALAVGVAGGAAGAYFLDARNGPHRRHVAANRVKSLLRFRAEPLPDPDLANKVRTEIFRDRDAPKGHVNVNAENGVVYLRGQVPSAEDEKRLATQTRQIAGVRDVVVLLHTPGEPAPTKETVAPGR